MTKHDMATKSFADGSFAWSTVRYDCTIKTPTEGHVSNVGTPQRWCMSMVGRANDIRRRCTLSQLTVMWFDTYHQVASSTFNEARLI